MIRNIKLKNFRGFQEEVSVRIRPITVLIGRNSAGKSSLMKFLLMLRQTLESQSDEFFVTNGKYLQLGSWVDLRNSRSRHRGSSDIYFQYSIEVETSDLPAPVIQELWSALQTNRVFETVDKYQLILELEKRPVTRESLVATFTISGRVRYERLFRHGMHEVSGNIESHRIFRKVSNNLRNNGFLRFGRSTDSPNDFLESVAADQFLDKLRYEFVSLRHLSPVREESLRTIQISSPPSRDVGDRGEYAIPHLVHLLRDEAHKEEAEFIQRFAYRVADVEKITPKAQIANLSTQIIARNRQTQSDSFLADFGFGVSQCLPIFIQGVMHDPHQLLLVEQPEAQLHPTAQLELGSFFAELWKQRQVPTIIETHSSNIILRLRRLVKENQINSDDVSIAFFTVEEVKSVPTVVVKNIDIQADGSLEKGLPMEFFGADVLEAIEMGAL
jgi:predicted ATPase